MSLYPILALLVSSLVSFFATPFVIAFAKKYGLVDDPFKKKHPKKIHEYPIPRAGGVAIFISIVISFLLFLPLDKHSLGIILGASLLVAVGVLDDKYDLSPYLRLILLFVAASIPILSGIGISFINNPLGGIIDLSNPQITFTLLGKQRSLWIVSDLFALAWIVFLMNILNMGAKGVDGQLSGVVAISASIIASLSLRYSADITEWPVIILSLIVAGAYFGFLPWHFYPQKIMPGFSGSTLAGYMLAILSILSTTKVGTLLVVLGIPIVDTGYTILRRVANGKSPFWGDTGHLHHRLLRIGFTKKQVSIVYWILTLILGIVALNLNAKSKLYTIIAISLVLGATILWLTYKPKTK
jgi:UDP-GlcNAc:undecaprenyl-phosphate GlcNAc-1-phosphate transferase